MSTKLLFLLGLYWMSKIGVTLGQSRECTRHIDYHRHLPQEPGWRCNNGECLNKSNVCNGSPQCSNGEDESPTACCTFPCPSDPDICIPAGQEIVPGQDCRDCTSYSNPGWRCNSGQCLDMWKVCNGSPDCSDASDESPATCCALTCPSDPDICISAGQERQHCRDCTNSYGVSGWRCNSGQCLGKEWVCDGFQSCSDGSDETPATCCASTCPSDPDICIPAGQEIVPRQDCRDCTDSLGDPGWRCNSGQCLLKGNKCDGSPQCSDGSDESQATCSSWPWFDNIFG